MSLSDPIGDMIARVKNAQARNHKKVELPSSNFKTKIADVLKNEGYINNFNQITFRAGVIKGLRFLTEKKYKIFVITSVFLATLLLFI